MGDNTLNAEIDVTEATRRLTYRERIAINILLTIFCVIYPWKYRHKCDEFFQYVKKILSEE